MPNDAPHILILSSWYPTENQPFLGNFVQRNAQLLAKKYRVSVIHIECAENLAKNEISERELQGVNEICARYPSGSRLSRFANRSRVFSMALKAVGDIDLIIGHVLLPHGWMFLQATRNKRCPFIWVEHGSYFRQDIPKSWSPLEKLTRRRVIAAASEIVAVSEVLKGDMTRFIWPKKIIVIGNHVDGILFHYKEKPSNAVTRFLHVSTLDANTKNPKGIFDACHLLKEEKIPFELTVISDEDASVWTAYVKEKNLDDSVSFVGPKDWKSMPEYYHNSDAFILNSDYETFSIVLAEALATGTPIISTEVGIVSQLPESNGICVEKNNPKALARAMRSFVRKEHHFNHEQIAQIGSQFYSENILEKWSHLIESHVG